MAFWKDQMIWNKKSKPDGIPKVKIKKPPDPEDKAWKEFSLYIRIRDALRTIGLPEAFRCISCRNIVPVKGNDAGHYVTRGNRAIKYDVRNVHWQSAHDNRFLSGNVIEYRKAMIELYGEEVVNELENTRDIMKAYVDWEEETLKWRKRRKMLERLFKAWVLWRSQAEVRSFILDKMLKFCLEAYLDDFEKTFALRK